MGVDMSFEVVFGKKQSSAVTLEANVIVQSPRQKQRESRKNLEHSPSYFARSTKEMFENRLCRKTIALLDSERVGSRQTVVVARKEDNFPKGIEGINPIKELARFTGRSSHVGHVRSVWAVQTKTLRHNNTSDDSLSRVSTTIKG